MVLIIRILFYHHLLVCVTAKNINDLVPTFFQKKPVVFFTAIIKHIMELANVISVLSKSRPKKCNIILNQEKMCGRFHLG
ncbi:hypothetical protein VIGAN_09033300 [Vigna angularis var. angularis]|uniref:Uncharacterized protein n=1 Tax=Vigna angularis var. angularis TaxID=157739 RepID=A0A0S3SW31_PHAAN|nr:hypothetical protein VIGAN_09033300 [Vigna angularis var. angularis]